MIKNKKYFWLTVRWVYGIFFILSGVYMIYHNRINSVMLFLLSSYLVLTGVILVSSERARAVFATSYFKNSLLGAFLLWLSIPFLVLSIIEIAAGKNYPEMWISLLIGILFISLGLFSRKFKKSRKN
ncbi:MAG: hypothetical protein KAR07_00465 [Spirochaetes bacterium]|nr:hypothetical protein [Spirochaetota bacterium]MCK5266613.1 hypothetical protein [Spirochaetota bacterium]